MKKILFILFFLFLSAEFYAQVNFEKGYFTDLNGHKNQGWIKNKDWKNNPDEIEFRSSEKAEIQKLSLEDFIEFGIDGGVKFIKATVALDRSKEDLNSLSYDSQPDLKEEEILLKVLIEGKADLYSYGDKNLRKYFYKMQGEEIQPLIYKLYKTSHDKTGENNTFRSQLSKDLQCAAIENRDIRNLKYRKRGLVKLFESYNTCAEGDFKNYEKPAKNPFHLSLHAGVANSSLSIQNSNSSQNNLDFKDKINFRFGFGAEYVFPFHKNKWALMIEPTYQSYKVVKDNQKDQVEYKSIEVPIGVRHYFYLDNHSAIFVNGAFVVDFPFSSFIKKDKFAALDIKNNQNLAFGLGYKYRNKYGAEVRYNAKRNITQNYVYWKSNYQSLSLIFSYTIF